MESLRHIHDTFLISVLQKLMHLHLLFIAISLEKVFAIYITMDTEIYIYICVYISRNIVMHVNIVCNSQLPNVLQLTCNLLELIGQHIGHTL